MRISPNTYHRKKKIWCVKNNAGKQKSFLLSSCFDIWVVAVSQSAWFWLLAAVGCLVGFWHIALVGCLWIVIRSWLGIVVCWWLTLFSQSALLTVLCLVILILHWCYCQLAVWWLVFVVGWVLLFVFGWLGFWRLMMFVSWMVLVGWLGGWLVGWLVGWF